jgi:hypothetical protein
MKNRRMEVGFYLKYIYCIEEEKNYYYNVSGDKYNLERIDDTINELIKKILQSKVTLNGCNICR